MKCQYCNDILSPLRRLTDGKFCCDQHRQAFQQGQAAWPQTPVPQATPIVSLAADPSGEPLSDPGLELHPPLAFSSFSSAQRAASPSLPMAPDLMPLGFETTPAGSAGRAPLHASDDIQFESTPSLPAAAFEPIHIPVDSELCFEPVSSAPDHLESESIDDAGGHQPEEGSGRSFGRAGKSLRWMSAAWANAPSDLKIMALLLPILLGVAIGPSVPKVEIPDTKNVQQVMNTQLKTLQQNITNRAAVSFADDFRSGLDAWDSHSNLTTSWSYDAAGFVRPGPLAIFKPSADMSDYRFEFLGEIDQRGMGCVFRAADLDNYYALKFTVVKPGPLPLIHMVRYAVINGKEMQRVEKPLPLTARKDTLYRVMLDIRGSDFTIMAQGQVVDFWSDNRLHRGGIGFFCNRGERARLRWVEVSHQYDTLGRLCAYLAPYGMEGITRN